MFNIKDKLRMIKFKCMAHKHYITPKGECYIHYIINKYINGTKPDDYIEAYEEMIIRNENRVRQINQFDVLYKDAEGNENTQMLHFLAANIALSLILISLREEDICKYINYINSARARQFIYMLAHPDKTIKNLT